MFQPYRGLNSCNSHMAEIYDVSKPVSTWKHPPHPPHPPHSRLVHKRPWPSADSPHASEVIPDDKPRNRPQRGAAVGRDQALARRLVAGRLVDAQIPYPCPDRSRGAPVVQVRQEDVALVPEFCGYDVEALREGLEQMIATWDQIEDQHPSSRRKGGRPRKAVSVSPAPRSKQRRASNA